MSLKVSFDGERVIVSSNVNVFGKYDMDEIPGYRHETAKHGFMCSFQPNPISMTGLMQQLYLIHHDGYPVDFNDDAKQVIAGNRVKLPHPMIGLKDGKVIGMIPHTPMWDSLCRKSGASFRANMQVSIPPARIRDFLSLNSMLPDAFKIKANDDVLAMVHAPIPAPYDGSDESLRHVDLDALDYVRLDAQPWNMREKKGTMLEKMHKMGYGNLHDLIVRPPLRYIDRSEPVDIRDLIDGERATIIGKVLSVGAASHSDKLILLTVEDRNGCTIDCSFFNAKYLTRIYHTGDDVIINGVYKPYYTKYGDVKPQMQHPQIDFADVDSMPVIPVYRQSGSIGVNSWMITACERELVDRLGDFRGPKWLEDAFMNAELDDENGNRIPMDGRMPYGEALKTMHAPRSMDDLRKADDSLSFCELVQMMTIIENDRRGEKPVEGISMRTTGELTGAYVDCLKYDLTGAQARVIRDIDNRMRSPEPMHALLVGDVGSGKTTVIHMAALKAVEAGKQAVICAPTEILARQLYDVFIDIIAHMPMAMQSRIHPILHSSYKDQSLKLIDEWERNGGQGKKPSAAGLKRANLKAMESGDANVVFGTHSVLNDDIKWHDLCFVGIDEQHKFGAEQRSRLLKVRDDGKVPDMLMQTATPIPRSIAQVFYGNIAYMHLDELPAGRLPIGTEWVKMKGKDLLEDKYNEIWHDIQGEANIGHGTFIICPMVEESEKLAAASVKTTYDTVKGILTGVKIGLVYGSQPKDEQAEMIDRFRKGEIQVLVASSVVEVGVSCEQATRMIVLDANRFGIASLHQIRGRIGRGNLPSTCYLVSMAFTQDAQNRMEALTETLDGWKLSQKDLKNRGAGTLFGESQSGSSDFMFADLIANGRWINAARAAALKALDSPYAMQAVNDSRAWFGLTDGNILS